jgi:hypothetical protein
MKLKIVFFSIVFLSPIFFLKFIHRYDHRAFDPKYFYQALTNGPFSNTPLETSCLEGMSFSYLAQGTQSVAFMSEDQKYVIKFFFKKKFKDHKKISLVDLSTITEFFNKTYKEKLKKIIKNLNRLLIPIQIFMQNSHSIQAS